jgi:hypothetical protein
MDWRRGGGVDDYCTKCKNAHIKGQHRAHHYKHKICERRVPTHTLSLSLSPFIGASSTQLVHEEFADLSTVGSHVNKPLSHYSSTLNTEQDRAGTTIYAWIVREREKLTDRERENLFSKIK